MYHCIYVLWISQEEKNQSCQADTARFVRTVAEFRCNQMLGSPTMLVLETYPARLQALNPTPIPTPTLKNFAHSALYAGHRHTDRK